MSKSVSLSLKGCGGVSIGIGAGDGSEAPSAYGLLCQAHYLFVIS
jgi:hypothetical protein